MKKLFILINAVITLNVVIYNQSRGESLEDLSSGSTLSYLEHNRNGDISSTFNNGINDSILKYYTIESDTTSFYKKGIEATTIIEIYDRDVSKLKNPQLSFWYNQSEIDYSLANRLYLEAWDGNEWDLVASITTTTFGWEEFTFLLTEYTYGNSFVKLRFRAASRDTDKRVENISISEAPDCVRPNTLRVNNITATSAELAWTSPEKEVFQWVIEYGNFGFVPGVGTVITDILTNSYNLTGLSPNTTYQFYVLNNCETGDFSFWSKPFTFTTCCYPEANLFYIQNYDSWSIASSAFGSTPSGENNHCLENIFNTTSNRNINTIVTSSSETNNRYENYTNTSIYLKASNKNANITFPEFNLSNLSIPGLEFWYYVSGEEQASILLQASIDKGITWDTLWQGTRNQKNEWIKAKVSLSPYYIGVTNAIFRISAPGLLKSNSVNSYPDSEAIIDDFKILDFPPIMITDISSVNDVCGLEGNDPIRVKLKNNDWVTHDSIPVCFMDMNTRITHCDTLFSSLNSGASATVSTNSTISFSVFSKPVDYRVWIPEDFNIDYTD